MNDFAELLCDGLKMLEDVTGATLTWKGKAYACVGGGEARSEKLELGGFQFNSDCPIVMRAAAFGADTPPGLKQLIVFSSGPGVAGNTWRVDKVTKLWGEVIVLDCNDPTQ